MVLLCGETGRSDCSRLIESGKMDISPGKVGFHGMNRTILTVILCVVVAGILYWFIWNDAPYIADDSPEYMMIAGDLRDGALDDLHVRSFGYPLLLVLAHSVEESSRLLYFIQLTLHLVAVILMASYLIRLRVPGILTALFLVLSLLPPSVVITASVLAEVFAEFLIVLGAFLLLLSLEQERTVIRTIMLTVSGLALGLLAVVRPSYQLLFIVLFIVVLLILRSRHAVRKYLLSLFLTVFMIPLLILGACYMYNYNKFGFAGLVPSFGIHLSTKTARVVERLPDEYGEIREILVNNRDSILVEHHSRHTGENYIWRAIPELQEATGLNKPELSDYLVGLNLVLIKQAPLHYVKDVLSAMTLYWFPSTTSNSNFGSRPLQLFWSIVHFLVILVFFLIVLLSVALLFLRWLMPVAIRRAVFPRIEAARDLLPSMILPLTIVVYAMLVSTLFEAGHQRYRTPTDLLVFFITVLGVCSLIDFRSSLRKRRNGR
jgi:hypothetical protein